MRVHYGIALILGLFATSRGFAQESVPAFPLRAVDQPSAFSLEGSIPDPSLGFVRFADQPAAPGLAGNAFEAVAHGLEPFFPAKLPDGPRNVLFISPAAFGGIKESVLFAGGVFRIGSVFRDASGITPFFRLDVAASYSKGDGATGLDAGVSGAAGLLGQLPLPWSLSFNYDAVISDHSVGELALEAGGRLLDLGVLGGLSAFGGLAFSTSFPVSGSSAADLSARALLEMGRRDYRGAFWQGYSAWAGGTVSRVFGSGDWAYAASLGAEGGIRLWHLAGLVASVSLRLDSEERSDWAGLLRGVVDSTASLSGDTGLLATAELPILFARGRLLKDDKLAVEFTIAPFVDAAFVQAAGTGLLEAGNFHCAAGLCLEMGIDAERQDSLRVSGGYDLSDVFGGTASGDGSIEIAAALFLAL